MSEEEDDDMWISLYICSIVILNSDGRLVHEFTPPLPLGSGNLAFTWAHGDECLIVAAGGTFAVGRVREAVPALGELIAYQTWLALGRTARNVRRLALPERANELIRGFDRHIIRVGDVHHVYMTT